MESMACKRANIVPRHSAYADWCGDGVAYVECDTIPFTTINGQNTLQKTPLKQSFIETLEDVYQSRKKRIQIANAGYTLVTQEKYTWKAIAEQFHTLLSTEKENGSNS